MEREDLIHRTQTPAAWEAEQRLLTRPACLLRLDAERFNYEPSASVRIETARRLMELTLEQDEAKLESEGWLRELCGEEKRR